MLVNKIITGHVVQTFETDTGLCTKQNFIQEGEAKFQVVEDLRSYEDHEIIEELHFPHKMIQTALSVVGSGFGYSFKANSEIGFGKVDTIRNELHRINGYIDMYIIDSESKFYLTKENGVGAIFGLENSANQEYGIIWGRQEKHVQEIIDIIDKENKLSSYLYQFPAKDKIYVQDGNLYTEK